MCVFKLEQDISEYIKHQFPCLPPRGYEFEPGTKCYVAGWGLQSAKGKVSPVLKSVNVNVIEDEWCMKLQDHSPKEMICAGAKETGKLQAYKNGISNKSFGRYGLIMRESSFISQFGNLVLISQITFHTRTFQGLWLASITKR